MLVNPPPVPDELPKSIIDPGKVPPDDMLQQILMADRGGLKELYSALKPVVNPYTL